MATEPAVRMHGRTVERGSVSPLVVALLATALLAVLGIGRIGHAAVVAEQAQAVADVAALAGATGGPEAAREVGAANGADRLRSRDAGPMVVVEVQHGPASARAAATSRRGPS